MNEPKIAVVGSGPSGCYAAQALRKDWPTAEISVIDQLPVPYGLIRYGIAPDHQGTKNVSKQFDRLFERDGINFVGNVHVGTDVTLPELRELFDVVVLSTGLSTDRSLGIPGARLPGVYGSGHVTRWLNSRPGDTHWGPQMGSNIVIIGNGNVALDLVRLLAKGPEEFDGSDVHDSVFQSLISLPRRHISVVGRSAAEDAKFDVAMLKELGKIRGINVHVAGAMFRGTPDGSNPKVDALNELAAKNGPDERLTVDFRFGLSPQRFEGTYRVTAAVFDDESGESVRIPTNTVLTAIGFSSELTSLPGLEDLTPSASNKPRPHRVAPGVYCVGWLRRGAQGTIPENRRDAKAVAAAITEDLRREQRLVSKVGVSGLPVAASEKAISFDDWKKIDAAEIAGARPGRVRCKFLTTSAMITAATVGNESTNLEGAQR